MWQAVIEMTSLFITGSESFIGQALRVMANKVGLQSSGVDSQPPTSRNFEQADVRETRLADHILEGTDALVHLAAISQPTACAGKAHSCFDINVMGTLNTIKAARKKKVRQIIFASSEWVYPCFGDTPVTEETVIDPQMFTSEYALSKYVSECNLMQDYLHNGGNISILRFGIVYGPRTHNWSAVESLTYEVAKNSTITVGSKKTARHFIHVKDIASAIIAVVGQTGLNVLNVQGPSLVTLAEIINHASALLEKKVIVSEIDSAVPSIKSINSKKITQLLGWYPKISINDGINDFIDYLKIRDAA